MLTDAEEAMGEQRRCLGGNGVAAGRGEGGSIFTVYSPTLSEVLPCACIILLNFFL